VIGDLFQQYATKYVGISRAIPLSNTNQLWGFAWGVLVFGELSHAQGSERLLALAASGVMIVGAMLIAGAGISVAESASSMGAVERECARYSLDLGQMQDGVESGSGEGRGRRPWWDFAIPIAAVGVFAWFADGVRIPRLTIQIPFALALIAVLVVVLAVCGWMLWKKTRFA
jgi:hypothetical protein